MVSYSLCLVSLFVNGHLLQIEASLVRVGRCIIYGFNNRLLELSLILDPLSRRVVVCSPLWPMTIYHSFSLLEFAEAAPIQSSAFKLPKHIIVFLISPLLQAYRL